MLPNPKSPMPIRRIGSRPARRQSFRQLASKRRSTTSKAIGRERITAYEAKLRDYALESLSRINSLTVYGTARDRGAIVSFNMTGAHPHDVSTIIDRAGVAVRAGTHCTQPLLARYGVTASCRASFGLYNTFEEVDRLAESLRKAHEFFA